MSVRIEQLSVLYRDGKHSLLALEEVNLEILPGRCLALVGESGSGKTTLGLACMGLLPKNASIRGTIRYNGSLLVPGDERAVNRLRWSHLAMVFQNGAAHLNPVHRIVDQVAEPLIQRALLPRTEALERASRLLEKVGLGPECLHRYPHELSGGQAQRAMIAMALILDPRVLILDEPTSALDPVHKGMVSEVIRSAKETGKAVLLITHDLEFAARNSDVAAVLYLGQIMETLPSGDLFEQPLHPYTSALVRSFPGMNRPRDLGGIRGDAFYRMVHRHGWEQGEPYDHSHIQVPGALHPEGHVPPTGCLFQDRCTQVLEKCRREKVLLEPAGTHTLRCLRHGIADLLVLEGVEKRYGEAVALHPASLVLKCGEVYGLVGETGSGKTTLAMIASGALKPDGGRRIFDGRDMEEWEARDYRSLARRIGVVYQSPAESVSHRFTVEEIVAEPLTIHEPSLRKKERRERVLQVLKDVHLSTDETFLGRYPHELNMGAIQRVCLARALVLEPSLLVADEPTSSLDPSVQAKVLKLLLDLQIERGLTLLLVTHDIGVARKICDRMGVMYRGHLVETGPAFQVLSNPSHPYTRRLIECASGHYPGNGHEKRFWKRSNRGAGDPPSFKTSGTPGEVDSDDFSLLDKERVLGREEACFKTERKIK
ncbi:MAG: ABC transporter ATP-binding protein [Deltaproteobacteria bacterium]|nr:ABC transporter ATP-binding protein [Deltaproteobacteria bacterium]